VEEGIRRRNHTPQIHPVHTAASHALHKYSIQKERNHVRSRHTFSLRTIYLLHRAQGRRFTAPTIKTLMPILDFDISPVYRDSNPDHILCARHNACRFYLTSIMEFYFVFFVYHKVDTCILQTTSRLCIGILGLFGKDSCQHTIIV